MSTFHVNCSHAAPLAYFNWSHLPNLRIKKLLISYVLYQRIEAYFKEKTMMRGEVEETVFSETILCKVKKKEAKLTATEEKLRAVEKKLMADYDPLVYQEGKKLEDRYQRLGNEINQTLEEYGIPSSDLNTLERRLKTESMSISDLIGLPLQAIPTIPLDSARLADYLTLTASEKIEAFEGFLKDNILPIQTPWVQLEPTEHPVILRSNLKEIGHTILLNPRLTLNSSDIHVVTVRVEKDWVTNICEIIGQPKGMIMETQPVVWGLVKNPADYQKITRTFAHIRTTFIHLLKRNEFKLLEESYQVVVLDKLNELEDKKQSALQNGLVSIVFISLQKNTLFIFDNNENLETNSVDRC